MLTHDEQSLILELAGSNARHLIPEVLELMDQRRLYKEGEQAKAGELPVKQGEIDWRRRRMEIAMTVLDEQNTSFSLEDIAAIIWPNQEPLHFKEQKDTPEAWCNICGSYHARIEQTSSRPNISAPTQLHIHKVRRDEIGNLLSSYCECGENLFPGGLPRQDISKPTEVLPHDVHGDLLTDHVCPTHGHTVHMSPTGHFYCRVDDCDAI